jgi:hypothetical protein
MARIAASSGLSATDGIALTAERYPKYNNFGAEVETSRPFQKLLNHCVFGACRMTPTIDQSSAPIARPRLLELSRQVAVDFQPDADFDERRRCPSHGFLPFLRQYHSRSSAYLGRLGIQEIKIIAFVYDPGSRFPPNLSAHPPGIALPAQHADPHDYPAGSRGALQASSLLSLGRSIVGNLPRPMGSPQCQRRRQGPLTLRLSNAAIPRGGPTQRAHTPLPFRQGHPRLPACLPRALFRRGRSNTNLTRTHPCARSAFLASARPSKPAKGRSCK